MKKFSPSERPLWRAYFSWVKWLACALWLLPLNVQANEKPNYKIPYSRNDSAQLALHDSVFHVRLKQGDLKEASRQLDAIAMICWNHNDLTPAVEHFERSLEINERLGNQNGIAGINSNLAFIYADLGEYKKAFDYFEKTLVVRRAEGKKVGIISCLINESVVLNNLKRYKLSVERLEEALTLAREMNDEVQMRSVYGMLSETYQKAGDAKKAMYYYEYYRTFNDHVTRQEVAQVKGKLEQQKLQEENLRLQNANHELQLAQQQWELDQQARSILSLTSEQRALLDSLSDQEIINSLINAENERQRLENRALAESKQRMQTLTVAAIVSLLLILAVATLLLLILRNRNRYNAVLQSRNDTIETQAEALEKANQQLKEANSTLQFQNQQILGSIRSSRTVQDAVFSHSGPLEELFPQSFLFARPCAIVSGDFHYFRKLEDGRKMVVVGDCTGHGVPGAFLTILAITALDRAVYNMQLRELAPIMHELDETFSQLNEGQIISRHSLDLSMLFISPDGKQIELLGAINGLLLVDKEGKHQHIKGSRLFLGHRYSQFPPRQEELVPQTINLQGPTWCYLGTDGLADQFNPNNEKLTTRVLVESLASSAQKPAEEQLKAVEQLIDSWQGKSKQIDDMLLIGINTGG